MSETQPPPKPVLIKKYSDRRLYDTSDSGYVTLYQIARMVREGADVRVVDARSRKDITNVIFAQIILEDARGRETAPPVQLLQQLVKASDRATHEFLSWYLNNTLGLYQKAQEAARARFPEASAAVSRPLEFVRGLLAGRAFPPPAPEAAEVEKLRRRVEQLEARLAGRRKPARPAARRRRRAAPPK